MENILVYSTPFKITEKKWGHKWIGFYNGKRFKLLQVDTTDFVCSETETEIIYTFCKANENMLPEGLNRIRYKPALSNHYFLYKEKEITIEIVMQLIEKGYDIHKIKMEIPLSWNDNEAEFLCRYVDKANGNIIVEVQKDKSILWKENIYD